MSRAGSDIGAFLACMVPVGASGGLLIRPSRR